MQLADRLQQIKPSATLAVAAKAAELKAAGHNVIGLGTGEPDFPTPQTACDAAIEAMRDGQTKYTAVDGTAELKRAIIGKFKRDNALLFDPSEVIVSTGAKQCLFNMLLAMINPGDEVLIPTPSWVSYPDMVRLAGGIPVEVFAGDQQNFKISAEQLNQAITPKTRLLMLNSPSNPTGMAYSKTEYQKLAEVLEQHPNVAISSDEIYEHIYWGDEPFISFGSACPQLRDRTMLVNGVSKVYAMTGWRIGYLAGPEALVKAMRKLQSQSTSNACSIAQAAAASAINGEQSSVSQMRDEFKRRHDWMIQALNGIPGVSCKSCDGAFYAFPSFAEAIINLPGVSDDSQMAEWLLEHAQVAVVPGGAFGAPGHLRLSYATDMDTLQEAIGRIRKAMEKA